MRNLVSALDEILPRWFAKTDLQWIQWIYAFWQLLRCNPIIILVLSVLPFCLRQWYRKKTVIIVDPYPGFEESELDSGVLAKANLEIIQNSLLESRDWCMIKNRESYYIIRQDYVREMHTVLEKFGDDIIFVGNPQTISGSLTVGKELSQAEAYERVFFKKLNVRRGTKYVVPTWLDYVEVNSKLWGILCTIPILLRAKDYLKVSNLLSVVIILLDINRHWLHKLYVNLIDRFTKFVKLNVFKKNTSLYVFFAMFSDRWNYGDPVKKHAYVAQVGETVNIRGYVKLERPEDLELLYWMPNNSDLKQGVKDERVFMRIFRDRCTCDFYQYKWAYVVAKLNRPLYVP